MIVIMEREYSSSRTTKDMKGKCLTALDQVKELSFMTMERYIEAYGKMMKNLGTGYKKEIVIMKVSGFITSKMGMAP